MNSDAFWNLCLTNFRWWGGGGRRRAGCNSPESTNASDTVLIKLSEYAEKQQIYTAGVRVLTFHFSAVICFLWNLHYLESKSDEVNNSVCHNVHMMGFLVSVPSVLSATWLYLFNWKHFVRTHLCTLNKQSNNINLSLVLFHWRTKCWVV